MFSIWVCIFVWVSQFPNHFVHVWNTVHIYLYIVYINCTCTSLHAGLCCHLNNATKAMWTVLERWVFKQYLFYRRSLPNRPLSISFDYPHAKIQIPQDTNSLSQNNYKMLDATVNTTSVTVTVCICHEMRQKQNEFALMNRIRGETFFCAACWLCYRRLFQPHRKWALMFHTGFAVEESKLVWERLVLTKCLFYPAPFLVLKTRLDFTRTISLSFPL